jgi:hypothetical protein
LPPNKNTLTLYAGFAKVTLSAANASRIRVMISGDAPHVAFDQYYNVVRVPLPLSLSAQHQDRERIGVLRAHFLRPDRNELKRKKDEQMRADD